MSLIGKVWQTFRTCERHGGVVTMTFVHNRSNVMCLNQRAVIPIPQKDGGP